MADTWGNRITLSLFGESHGAAVGIVVDGLSAGIPINKKEIEREMRRRAPGNSPLATARSEADEVEILSGLYQGKTTGAAICGLIRNTNAHCGDYGPIPRPGHADLTARIKYGGHADMRGGGHFSGRLTAPIVFAGALCRQVLALRGISVYGRIVSIGTVSDPSPTPEDAQWPLIAQHPFPAADWVAGEAMQECILACKAAGDSVGGVVEVAALGVPAGVGSPFFASVESVASSLFFSIPAVKGVEFGDGFALSAMSGSEANDAICAEDGAMTTLTNRCGGILGGITTGRAVIARVACKPTPSISLPQNSVDPDTLEQVTLQTKGRHDPCIVPRAVPVIEAALAIALLECMGQEGPL